MDLQSLEAFIAVAETGSFSRAGEQLFLTQPAVSKRIANLESSLNSTLFDRIGRDVYLTEAGNLLLIKAKSIIDEIKDLQSEVSQLSSQDVRQLSMASSHHIGLHYLGPILRKFVDQNPVAHLDLRFMESEQAIDSLLKRKIELAITTIPNPLPKELIAKTIWQDNLKFVIAADQPLAKRRKSVRLNELAHLTAILPDEHTTTYRIIEQTFTRHHIPLRRHLSINYLETIQELVSHGLGWSLLPESMISNELVVLEVEQVELTRKLGIIQHRQRSLSRGARALIDIIEQSKQPL